MDFYFRHVMNLTEIALTSVTCYALHSLLLAHHITTCQQTFVSVFLSNSKYCQFVWGAIQALQWLPITLVAPLLSFGTTRLNMRETDGN